MIIMSKSLSSPVLAQRCRKDFETRPEHEQKSEAKLSDMRMYGKDCVSAKHVAICVIMSFLKRTPLFLFFEMVGYVFFCFNLYVVFN